MHFLKGKRVLLPFCFLSQESAQAQAERREAQTQAAALLAELEEVREGLAAKEQHLASEKADVERRASLFASQKREAEQALKEAAELQAATSQQAAQVAAQTKALESRQAAVAKAEGEPGSSGCTKAMLGNMSFPHHLNTPLHHPNPHPVVFCRGVGGSQGTDIPTASRNGVSYC